MLTMRATPKISENPIANRAYTPPLTRPVTSMSWSNLALVRRQPEGLHPFDVRRPERHLLAVLPLHRDARGLADRPDEIVALVERHGARGADVLGLLHRRDQLVGVERAGLLDVRFEEHDRVVRRGVVGGRLAVALLEGTDERHGLRRHLDLGVGIERRHVLRLARCCLPELVLLALDVAPPRDRLHVALAHLAADDDAHRA